MTPPPFTPAAAPLLISVPDAARMIGVGRSTAYELIRDRSLETVKVRGRRLVPVEAITAFVAARRGTP